MPEDTLIFRGLRTYPGISALEESFRRTYWIITRHVEGMSHEESLIQPPGTANCLNWVLGHILVSRDTAIELLGGTPLFTPEETARYARGSRPITEDAPDVLPLEELLHRLARSQEILLALLAELDEIELERPITWGEQERPLGERLAFLHWHETYHSGQLEYLRQLAGYTEPVLP